MLGIVQGLIVALYIIRTNAQNSRLSLNLLQKIIRRIILRQKIHADDPLHQGIRHFSHLKKNKPQQISCFPLVLIKMQGLLQQLCGTA